MSSFSRRPLLPKPPTDNGTRDNGGQNGQNGPPPLPPPPPHKREMVRVACQACRARKIKCDARRPICSPCTTRNRSCEYETEADVDRYTSLKRRHIRLEKDHSELMELFEMIKVRPTRDAQSILNRVGSTQDLGDTLSFVKQGDLLIQTAEESQSPISPDSSPAVSLLTSLHPLAYPALGPLDECDAGLGERRLTLMQAQPGRHGNNLTQDDIDAARDLSRRHRLVDHQLYKVCASRWTSVTAEDTVVANLVSMYLSWDHATCRIFDEKYFIEQLVSGEEAYCSPLLVNAILAVATLNYKAVVPQRSADLSARFHQEAVRLWHATQAEGGLLLVPVSILLDNWCKAVDDEASGHQYLLRGIQVAKEVGLFDQTSGIRRGSTTSPKTRNGRMMIAWGLFNWQAVDSLVVHRDDRFSQLPGMTITGDVGESAAEWDSFPLIRRPLLLDRHLALQTLSALCIVLHQHLDLRARVERADKADRPAYLEDAKGIFVNLLDWADNLPPSMARSAECLPLVIDMHMYFHTAVVDLFEPFRRGEAGSSGLAHELSDASFSQLRRLLYIQRYRFGGPPQSSTTLHPIRVLTIDLLERISRADAQAEEEEETEFYIILCIDALMRLSACFPVTKTILRGVVEGADMVGMRLPEEVLAMFRGVGEAYFRRPTAVSETGSDQSPMELDTAVADPSEAVMEWLEEAAWRLKLR